MKTPLNLIVTAVLFCAASVCAQDIADLLSDAQRAYVRGDSAQAKEKFELVRRLEPDNRTAIMYLRRIIAEEAKGNKQMPNVTQALLEQVILPRLELREASLAEALEFLRQKGNQIGEGKVAINFVLQIDEATKANKVTLNLQKVPFTEALRYIGELANVQFVYEKFAIAVKPKGAGVPEVSNTPAPGKDAKKIPGLN